MRHIDEFEAYILIAESGLNPDEYRALVIPGVGYMEIQHREIKNAEITKDWHLVKYMPPIINQEGYSVGDYMNRFREWLGQNRI